jgi:AraC-like DNA-binding protein
MDVLADLLSRARAQGALFAHTTLPAPWGLTFGDTTRLGVHTVLDGAAWLRREDGAGGWLRVGAGQVALVRAPTAHTLASAPGTPAVALDAVVDAWRTGPRSFVKPGDGPATTVLCGAYRFEGSICDVLLGALPPVVHLEAPGPQLRALLGLLRAELAADRPGGQTVLDRLLDAALVLALREHFSASATPAVLNGLADPEIGRALGALHADPARAWTVAALAAEVGLSRAALARRFAALVGRPPLAYLTGLRMALAEERLRESDDKLGVVAASVGYGSEFAFSTAFKRHHGVAPATWRRAARAAVRTVATAAA